VSVDSSAQTPAKRSDEQSNVSGVCQRCGAPYVHHRSHLLRAGEQLGQLVLLCDDCHRERHGL